MKDRGMDRNNVRLYLPKPEDLWFRRSLLADPETMSYNRAWGGTIPFPKEHWDEWYTRWIRCADGTRFYRYITADRSRIFVGETAYHYDPESGSWLADVIIHARYRGRGYGREGLRLLCEAARTNGIAVLKDTIAADNPAVRLFLQEGFVVESVTEQIVTVAKKL